MACAHRACGLRRPSFELAPAYGIEFADRRPGGAAAPQRSGLPDRLKSGIESLSGLAMDAVQVQAMLEISQAEGGQQLLATDALVDQANAPRQNQGHAPLWRTP